MLTYEEFREEVMTGLMEAYASTEDGRRILDTYEVGINSFNKQNTKEWGVTFKAKDVSTNISPVIYLTKAYEGYKNGESIENIVNDLVSFSIECIDNTPSDLKPLTEDLTSNYASAKNRIYPCLCKTSLNEERLQGLAHTDMDDLSVIYRIDFGQDDDGGQRSALVTNNVLELWGITTKELHETAIKNNQTQIFAETMYDFMAKILPPKLLNQLGDLERNTIILRTRRDCFGAAAILDKNYMSRLKEMIGDYYIIPSSIHEVLIYPKSIIEDLDELNAFIDEVNTKTVDEMEVLSDHAYEYDFEEGKIVTADFNELGETLD